MACPDQTASPCRPAASSSRHGSGWRGPQTCSTARLPCLPRGSPQGSWRACPNAWTANRMRRADGLQSWRLLLSQTESSSDCIPSANSRKAQLSASIEEGTAAANASTHRRLKMDPAGQGLLRPTRATPRQHARLMFATSTRARALRIACAATTSCWTCASSRFASTSVNLKLPISPRPIRLGDCHHVGASGLPIHPVSTNTE